MNENSTKFHIKVNENGPYLVSGGVPLTKRYPAKTVYGEPMAWDPVGVEDEASQPRRRYELCRCGHSANKPFCDNSHERVGFEGELTADRRPIAQRRRTIPGTGVVMTDDNSLCADAGFCGTRFVKVWKMIERTDDPEVRERLLQMVANCPSGRLEAWLEDGASVEPSFDPSIAVVPDGPLWVRGGIEIEAPDGFTYEVRNRVTLCRCGESKNMPFCDGTHDQINFKAP